MGSLVHSLRLGGWFPHHTTKMQVEENVANDPLQSNGGRSDTVLSVIYDDPGDPIPIYYGESTESNNQPHRNESDPLQGNPSTQSVEYNSPSDPIYLDEPTESHRHAPQNETDPLTSNGSRDNTGSVTIENVPEPVYYVESSDREEIRDKVRKHRPVKRGRRCGWCMKATGIVALCLLALLTCGMARLGQLISEMSATILKQNEEIEGLVELAGGMMVTHNGNRYMFFKDVKTFQEARETCETIGMTLTSVKSAEENSFIADHIGRWEETWIGGVSNSTEPETWRWFSEEETWLPRNTSVYQNWGTDQPNRPGTDNCMSIYAGQWWDDACTDKYSFICKTGKM